MTEIVGIILIVGSGAVIALRSRASQVIAPDAGRTAAMIISRARRYVFVHIPKTGGTAMARALESRAAADDILIGDTPEARRRRQAQCLTDARGRLWKHATLADIDGLVTRQELAAFLTFTLVRNPWDRLVSYYHWLTDQRFAHPAVSIARETDFSGFLNHPMTRRAIAANSYESYMRDARGRCMIPSTSGSNLDADLAPVRRASGIRSASGAWQCLGARSGLAALLYRGRRGACRPALCRGYRAVRLRILSRNRVRHPCSVFVNHGACGHSRTNAVNVPQFRPIADARIADRSCRARTARMGPERTGIMATRDFAAIADPGAGNGAVPIAVIWVRQPPDFSPKHGLPPGRAGAGRCRLFPAIWS